MYVHGASHFYARMDYNAKERKQMSNILMLYWARVKRIAGYTDNQGSYSPQANQQHVVYFFSEVDI